MEVATRAKAAVSYIAEELQPLIETVQSQIEKLETMSTCCEKVHATTSPNMVDAVAAAELPSMSSDGSESIRADGEYSPCSSGH